VANQDNNRGLSVVKNPVRQKLNSPEARGLRERGQVILMVGLATVVMFGIVGLAVDVGRLYVTRVELGRAVDSAALSGILEFDGTIPGLAVAKTNAEWYFDQNEPGPGVWREAWPNPDANELTMDATKSVNMIFLSVLGINTASVSAHAKAGFGTQFLDAALVLDATPSMAGNPIAQAKLAATSFKNILLGSNPTGNVKVGVTAFRGCFKATSGSSTPHSECVPLSTWKTDLVYSHATLDTVLTAIAGGGGSVGTNVCTGLAKGWDIISGPGNHNNDITYPGNRQYLILLSDGDNYYPGNNTYTAPSGDDNAPMNSASTPQGTVIGTGEYPCQPNYSCGSPWNTAPSNTPCINGVYGTGDLMTDDFNSNTWTGGTGWSGNWTATGNATLTNSSTPLGSHHVRLTGTGASNGVITRTADFSGISGADLEYSIKRNSAASGTDRVYVEVSTDGSSWTTLRTHNNGGGSGLTNTGTNYAQQSIPLPAAVAYAPSVYIRFRGSMSSTTDQFFVDSITISSGSANGYLDGNDGSNPTYCDDGVNIQTNTPRERQLDVRSLRLAREMKLQEVEIFVVAFAGGVPGCNLDPDNGYNAGLIYNDEETADCNAVNDSTPGPIGNNTDDRRANFRLLMCIASNTQDSHDHYFFANDESELQGIFTKIANQIAHRLIE